MRPKFCMFPDITCADREDCSIALTFILPSLALNLSIPHTILGIIKKTSGFQVKFHNHFLNLSTTIYTKIYKIYQKALLFLKALIYLMKHRSRHFDENHTYFLRLRLVLFCNMSNRVSNQDEL